MNQILARVQDLASHSSGAALAKDLEVVMTYFVSSRRYEQAFPAGRGPAASQGGGGSSTN